MEKCLLLLFLVWILSNILKLNNWHYRTGSGSQYSLPNTLITNMHSKRARSDNCLNNQKLF